MDEELSLQAAPDPLRSERANMARRLSCRGRARNRSCAPLPVASAPEMGSVAARSSLRHRSSRKAAIAVLRLCSGEPCIPRQGALGARSEEHTSELQSLMRISYAVFCLKKKTKKLLTKQDRQH